MSCCSKKRYLTVSYEGKTKNSPVFYNNYYQLLQWIYKEFSELRCYGLNLKVNSIYFKNQDEYSRTILSSRILDIEIEKVVSEVTSNLGIFKLRINSDDLLCTGFLLSPQHALIPKEQFFAYNVKDFCLLFEDNTEKKIKIDGMNLVVANSLILVELESEVLNYQPICFETTNQSTNILGNLFYYCKRFPVLNKKKIIFSNNVVDLKSLDLYLDEGTIGSPIISSDDSSLLAVVSEDFSIISFSLIYDEIKDKILVQETQYITEDNLSTYMTPTICYLDWKNNRLVYYSSEEAVNKSIPFVKIIKGSSATICSYGIFISGLCIEQQSRAWLFNGNSIKELPPPQKKHLYHSSIVMDNQVYIISGTTSSVEVYDFQENCWNFIFPLPKRRAMATSIVFSTHIFIMGGKREEKILKSILKLDNEGWKKIELVLPAGLASFGCIQIHKEFLIFGGDCDEGKNSKSWMINIKKKRITEENYSVINNFSRFPILYLENEVLMYSNDGVLLKYDRETQEIYTLSLDEEQRNSFLI